MVWFTDKSVPFLEIWREQSLGCSNDCSLQISRTGTFLLVNQNGSNLVQALLITIWSYGQNLVIFKFLKDNLMYVILKVCHHKTHLLFLQSIKSWCGVCLVGRHILWSTQSTCFGEYSNMQQSILFEHFVEQSSTDAVVCLSIPPPSMFANFKS